MHKIQNSTLLFPLLFVVGCAPSLNHETPFHASSVLELPTSSPNSSFSLATGSQTVSGPKLTPSDEPVRHDPVGAVGGFGLPLVVAGVPAMIGGGIGMAIGTTYSPKRSERYGYPVELDYGSYGKGFLVAGVVSTVVGIPFIVAGVLLQKKHKRQQTRMTPSLSSRGIGFQF